MFIFFFYVFFFVFMFFFSFFFFFFFSSRRRHTRYIGDWSSDVCSSDLKRQEISTPGRTLPVRTCQPSMLASQLINSQAWITAWGPCSTLISLKIGRASCRERV